jgi:glycosyltransferase involved in cell wall biosynthesis
MGTPGTYHLVGAYARHATVRVVASDKKDANVSIVYQPPADLDLHEVTFGVPGYAKRIAEIAKEFKPDIVCLGNYHGWFEIVERVKRDLPEAKYVLDIKSPLISEANSARQLKIQAKGAEFAHLLDLVVTRCMEDVESWIPNCARPIAIYPLGVKLSQFSPRQREGERVVCSRFVFIGSYSKNRKLDKLISFVAALPDDLKSGMSFDMYGSGPEKDNLKALVEQSGLKNVVQVLDGMSQDELLSILPQYDAGIGWVPKEIYDAAPSLKVLEYLGSGLVPVMSATQGHMRNIEDGFKGLIFEENAESFASAIRHARDTGFSADDISENLLLMKKRDWDAVATQNLLPAFKALLSAGPAKKAKKVSAIPNTAQVKQQPRMRVLMISPRPFGLLGTPGTYHLAEAYARHAEVCVIATKQTNQAVRIVHRPSSNLRLHEIAFQTRRYLREIAEIAKEFRPDIVWIGNFNIWPDIAVSLKEASPDAKIVLDVKSPLLTGEEHERRKEIQNAGIEHAGLLDLVIALSAEDIQTWIPDFSGRTMLYPLGIKMSQFSWKAPVEAIVKPRRFVFIGSYQAARKLDVMIGLFAGLPDSLKTSVTLDLYGDGPERSNLSDLVAQYGLQDQVHVHDCLDQDELFRILPQYDAGLGWVPRELYDAAPPLKTLEFMGTGLIPVVTRSTAHERYQSEGFAMLTFEENQDSFSAAINKVCGEGFTAEALRKNRAILEYRDFDRIVLDRHFPAYQALLGNKEVASGSYAGLAAGTPAEASAAMVPVGKKQPKPKADKEGQPEPVKWNKGQHRHASALDRVLLWSPDVVPFVPPVRKDESRLRVGFIGGDRVFSGLQDEVDIILLQPDTWQASLRYGNIDFILIESTWVTATGDWYMAQSSYREERQQLEALIRMAKELGIPTAYWLTQDVQYLPLYQDFLVNFDKVYCADRHAVEALAQQHIPARLLEPAFQPRQFNPIRVLGQGANLHPGFIYDGWADMFRHHDHHAVLKRLGPENCSIIDTTCMMAKLQLERTHDSSLKAAIKGWVPRYLLPEIYKRGSAYLSFSTSHTTPIQAAWAMLEAAACRVVPIHLGKLEDGDLRKRLARQWDDADSFVADVRLLAGNELKRDKAAHLVWREAHSHHTYRHRLDVICEDLGLVERAPRAMPKATLVTGTMRLHLLDKCIEQYLNQTYPNKELILVYNGSPKDIAHLKTAYADRSDIKIAAIPTDHFAGTLLNYGAMNATGEYFFRVDDDDHYGDNYIHDSMMYMQAFDADIFGKRASFFHFEGDDTVYLRKNHLPEIACFPANKLHATDKTLISGCSFACKTELLREVRYPDHINLSADTELIARFKDAHPDGNCLILDNLNLVVERFSDVRKHTWQQSTGALKDASEGVCNNISEIMV